MNAVTTVEGASQTGAIPRTNEVTHQLIVTLWTLWQAVTHVNRMDTHRGSPAAVEPRAGVALARLFVFVAWAVVHAKPLHFTNTV